MSSTAEVLNPAAPDVAAFVHELESSGVRLWCDSGTLRFRASRTLESEELAALKQKKAEILAFLEADAGGLGPRERGSCVALSYAQERLWLLEQMGLVGAAYNIVMAYRLEGPLERQALADSLAELVARHESLRTCFSAVSGVPQQIVGAGRPPPLDVRDLSGETVERQELEVETLLAAELQRAFDLERGPLLRATLLHLGEDHHVLAIALHHIISDGWSSAVLTRDLAAFYNARVAGTALPAPLPLQYPDYALWQRERLAGSLLDRELRYWKTTLAGAPAVLDLPLDHVRPAQADFAGDVVRFNIAPETREALQALARDEGATLYMVLLAAFDTLLYRWTGQTDILVGSPVAGRADPALDDLIGFFVNTLVLRADLSDNPTFRDLLRQVKETTLNALAHQNLPFEKLVAELQPERDLSMNPVFQVAFAFHETRGPSLDLAHLKAFEIGVDHPTAKFDLSLHVHSDGAGFDCGFESRKDLFERSSMEALAEQFSALLR